jgi:isoleucyl-tRNA synthetase
MDYNYEADILKAFNEIYKKGFITRGRKPIHWCPSCKTALAEAEVEYQDHTSPSIYVKFKVTGKENLFAVIWTTTPWTLPANLAVSIHPQYIYNIVRVKNENLIIARDLVEKSMKEMEIDKYDILEEKKGKEFEGMAYEHPLMDKVCPIVFGEHVTLEQGTGCVHTAPGHGADDYQIGKLYGLEIFAPIDNKGCYTDEYPEFEGVNVFDANPLIVQKLNKKGILIKERKITHSYPHCWRCHNPLIFRATPQWFIDTRVPELKGKVIKFAKDTRWIPKWGEIRFSNMIENRIDWCISRQRSWGVPIPSLVCEDCGEEFIDENFNEDLIEKIRERSSDIWFKEKISELTDRIVKCPKCGSNHIVKGENILDVWFDSGVSWYAVVKEKMGEDIPVDLYLEGSDQYRGWFQSSMWPSAIINGSAPYKKVITHGFSLDENGRPMSKSVGNVISPNKVVKKYGAEILRLWVSSIDYTEDFRFSYNALNQMVDAYKNIRNKIRFILMNTQDFDPKNDNVHYSKLETIDKWALYQLSVLINKIDKAYKNYEFHQIHHLIIDFVTVILSSLYFDMIKSRLYTDPPGSRARRSAQTVLYSIVNYLTQRLSPILSFTMEEVFLYLTHERESIFFKVWEQVPEEWGKWDDEYDLLFNMREKAEKELENLRAEKKIGLSLDAQINIYYKNDSIKAIFDKFDLEEFFIVSKVTVIKDNTLGEVYKIEIKKATGEKCARCWKYKSDLDENGICSDCRTQIKNWKKED